MPTFKMADMNCYIKVYISSSIFFDIFIPYFTFFIPFFPWAHPRRFTTKNRSLHHLNHSLHRRGRAFVSTPQPQFTKHNYPL